MRLALYPIFFERVMHPFVSDLFVQRVFPIVGELFCTKFERELKQMTGGIIEMRRLQNLKGNTEFR